ncbi:MAG: DoxX family protein [Gammaproteobacteria bacterium]
MRQTLGNLYRGYFAGARGLAWAAPFALLLLRLWVAVDFWRAGAVKIADMHSTIALFQYVYHTPLLAPVVAAWIGTMVELITPWFLGLGIAGRLTAIFLFFYNIIAVISYPALWPHGLWNGFWGGAFTDHKVWGLMLLTIALFGPGKLSLDYVLERWAWPRIVPARLRPELPPR